MCCRGEDLNNVTRVKGKGESALVWTQWNAVDYSKHGQETDQDLCLRVPGNCFVGYCGEISNPTFSSPSNKDPRDKMRSEN